MEWYYKCGYNFPNFELMSANGIDAIWLTYTGMLKTENLFDEYNLHRWDCESVLIMNKNAINNGESCCLI